MLNLMLLVVELQMISNDTTTMFVCNISIFMALAVRHLNLGFTRALTRKLTLFQTTPVKLAWILGAARGRSRYWTHANERLQVAPR